MKRFLIAIILTIIAVAAASANDGVFYASGGTLVPLQETRVELRKELLKFYVVDHGYARVEVDFEFFNPGGDRSLTVGFVTPPAMGDVDDERAAHPFITDFTVDVNSSAVEFEIKKLADTSFKMGTVNVTGKDFVYYFPVTFKRGMNKIRHTYRFRGGASVELQRDFDYQITTGKRWANKRIDDFELQVHPDNGIFAIIASFQKNKALAPWEIVGDGTIEKRTRKWFTDDGPRVRLFHLNSGYLRLRVKNFRPDNDLFFGEFNWPAGWINLWCDSAKPCYQKDSLERIARYFNLDPYSDLDPDYMKELTATDFKFIRNFFFAVRGLAFRDPDLRRFFGQFFWYKPNLNLKASDIVLSKSESEFLTKLAAFEPKPKK